MKMHFNDSESDGDGEIHIHLGNSREIMQAVVSGTTGPTDSLPAKSGNQYERAYKLFLDWRRKHQTVSFSEDVMLAYFQELSAKMKPTSMWSIYSMLRMTINIKNNIDVSQYTELSAFLKRASDGYTPKKSSSLTSQQIREFIASAPDENYLFTKVGLIFAIKGACRRDELLRIKTTHVEDLKTALLVHIPDTKSNTERQFVIGGNLYNICKKYMELRPSNLVVTNFFLNYQRGRCTKQPIGINKFGSLASQVAIFLKLRNPTFYTGHCMRRSSAIVLIDSIEEEITVINHHEQGQPSSVTQDTIRNDIGKTQIGADGIEYSRESLDMAVRDVMEGLRTIKHASNYYKIPQTTIQFYMNFTKGKGNLDVNEQIGHGRKAHSVDAGENLVSGVQEESEEDPAHTDLDLSPECSYPSTSGSHGFSELEQPYANLSDLPRTDNRTSSGEAFCRLCLRTANKEKMIYLTPLDASRSERVKAKESEESGKYAQMIKSLIPNLDFSLVHEPIMCHLCSTRLELACQFVEETLESQKTIKAYRDQYVGNDGKVLCEDVIKYKTRPSELGPPKKKKKLTIKTANPDNHQQKYLRKETLGDDHRNDLDDYLVTAEELMNITRKQPLNVEDDVVKSDRGLCSAKSGSFARFETVSSENPEVINEEQLFIKTEPSEEADVKVDPFGLFSGDQNLGTISNIVNYNDLVPQIFDEESSINSGNSKKS